MSPGIHNHRSRREARPGMTPGFVVQPQPPCDSTTLRQASDSFALFSRRHAFICGGLPTCSAQNLPASERQAICSGGLGPDCAEAGRKAVAARNTSDSVADARWFGMVMVRL